MRRRPRLVTGLGRFPFICLVAICLLWQNKGVLGVGDGILLGQKGGNEESHRKARNRRKTADAVHTARQGESENEEVSSSNQESQGAVSFSPSAPQKTHPLFQERHQQQQVGVSASMRFAALRESVLRNDASVSLGPDLMESWGLSSSRGRESDLGGRETDERREGGGSLGGSSFVEMEEKEEEGEEEEGDSDLSDSEEEEEEEDPSHLHRGTPGPPSLNFSEETDVSSEDTKDTTKEKRREKRRRRREPGGYFTDFLQQKSSKGEDDTKSDDSITSVPVGAFEEITFGFTSVKRTGFNHIETWPNEEGTLPDQLSFVQPLGGRVSFAKGVLFHYGGALRIHGMMPPLIRGDGLANGFTIYLTLKFAASAAGKRKQVLFDNGHGFQIVALPSLKKELTGLRVGFLWQGDSASSEEGEEGGTQAGADTGGGGYFVETCFGHVQSFVFSGYTAGGMMRLSIYKEQLAGSAFEIGGGFKQTASDPHLSGDEGSKPAQEGQWVLGCGVEAKHCFDGLLYAAKFVMKSQADSLVQVAQTIDGLDGLAGRTTACGNGQLEGGEDCDPLNDPKNLCSCTCHSKCPMFEEYLQTFSRHLLVGGSDGNGFGDWRRISCQKGFSSNDPAREDEVVMCKGKGEWEIPTIQCMADCTTMYSPPPELAVAGFTESRRHNTQLQVVCPGGTAPAEGITDTSRTVACIDGEWTKPALSCYPLCPEYTDLNGAYVVSPRRGAGSLRHGATRNVTCAEGYSKSTGTDPQIVWCADGEWGAQTLDCQLDCPAFEMPTDGHYRLQEGFGLGDLQKATRYGDFIPIVCEEGYAPASTRTRPKEERVYCRGGVWDFPLLQCFAECPPFEAFPISPAVSDRYEVKFGGNAHGSVSVVTCKEGYGKEGESQEIQCLQGSYEALELDCHQNCPTTDLYAKLCDPMPDGSGCHGPYIPQMTDTEGKTIAGSLPREISYGTKINVKCNKKKGFRAIESEIGKEQQISCLGDPDLQQADRVELSFFSSLLLTCEKVCSREDIMDILSSPAYEVAFRDPGKETFTPAMEMKDRLKFDPGAEANIVCAANFSSSSLLQGEGEDAEVANEAAAVDVLRCIEGEWSARTLACAPLCPEYTELEHFPEYSVKGRGTEHGNEREITCADRASSATEERVQVVRCVNGLWTARTLICRRDCAEGDLPNARRGYSRELVHDGSNPNRPYTSHGAVWRFQCDTEAGFSPVKCDGGKGCKESKPEDTGYNTAQVACVNGMFSPLTLLCMRGCNKMPAPDLVRYQLSKDHAGAQHGDSIKVMCTEGHYGVEGPKSLTGKVAQQQTLTCSDGEWEPLTLVCKKSCIQQKKATGPDDDPRLYFPPWGYNLTETPPRVSLNSARIPHGSKMYVECADGWRPSSGSEPSPVLCDDGEFSKLWLVCAEDCRPEDVPIHSKSHMRVVGYENTGPEMQWRGLPMSHGVDLNVKCEDGTFPVPGTANEENMGEMKCRWGTFSMPLLRCHPPCNLDGLRQDVVKMGGRYIVRTVGTVEEATKPGGMVRVECRDDAEPLDRENVQVLSCLNGAFQKVSIFCRAKCPEFSRQEEGYIYTRIGGTTQERSMVNVRCEEQLSTAALADGTPVMFDHEILECIHGVWMDRRIVCYKSCQFFEEDEGIHHLVDSKEETGKSFPEVLHGTTRLLRCKGDTNRRSGFFPAAARQMMDTQIYKCAERQCTKNDNSPYKIVRSILRNNPAAFDPLGGPIIGDEDMLDRARLHGDLHIVTCNTGKGFSPVWRQMDSFHFEQNHFDTVGGCPGPFDIYDPMKNQWLPLFTQNRLEYYKLQAKVQAEAPAKPMKKRIHGPLASDEMRSFVNTHDSLGRAERAPALIWKIEARRIMGLLAAPWWTMYELGEGNYPGDLKSTYNWQKYERLAAALKKKVGDSTNTDEDLKDMYKETQFATEGRHPDFIQNINETIPLYKHWAIWGPGCCDPTNCWRGLWGPSENQCSSRWWGRGSWVVFERLSDGKRETGREVYYSFCNAGGTWVPSERISSGKFPQDSVQTIMYHPEYHYLHAVPEHRTSEDFYFSEPVLPTLVDPRRKAKTPWQNNIKDIRGGPDGDVVLDAYNTTKSELWEGWDVGEPKDFRNWDRYPGYLPEDEEKTQVSGEESFPGPKMSAGYPDGPPENSNTKSSKSQ
uniref:Sushi domain-containing protein n=1 Tax=Chromera velia CCMP2878 TaxID=1169474 RepID=A0A0G4F8D9_9ALVE|eukprot:Cvel_15621.t1-p1 / transcript=Cvel_15621.t1 / gene=Cvel_15621 / organism=Chromera_velia_CCMP2878 / gene_product=P-selectin, putative / transcript_product=P-selectin, putative / location=Cvel_scaffold1163:10217-32649(-) / protein_length=2151 / sequence_SO=supercontig / SO=protein_coding / is_pseudo=false